MDKLDDGGPAFPHISKWCHEFNDDNKCIGCFPTGGDPGMTLRDYFAAAALQGMLAYSYVNPQRGNYHENCTFEGAAFDAYQYADEMIKARKKSA